MYPALHDLAGDARWTYRENGADGACKRITNGDSSFILEKWLTYFAYSDCPSSEPQGKRPQR